MQTAEVVRSRQGKINDDDYPRLKKLRDEEDRLHGVIEDYKHEMTQVASEGGRLDAKIKLLFNLDDLSEASTERARLKFRFDQLGYEMRAAESQLARVTDEREQWRLKFDAWENRRASLIVELGTAIESDAPVDPYSPLVGRETVRSHQQVKFELEQTDFMIRGFSN